MKPSTVVAGLLTELGAPRASLSLSRRMALVSRSQAAAFCSWQSRSAFRHSSLSFSGLISLQQILRLMLKPSLEVRSLLCHQHLLQSASDQRLSAWSPAVLATLCLHVMYKMDVFRIDAAGFCRLAQLQRIEAPGLPLRLLESRAADLKRCKTK